MNMLIARARPPMVRQLESEDDVSDSGEQPDGSDADNTFAMPTRLMKPVVLASTQQRIDRDASDEAACSGRVCVLCDIGIDSTIPGAADAIVDIFAQEDKLRSTMNNDVLFEGLAKQFNTRIVAQARIVGKVIEPLTFEMTRRHFVHNHDRSLERDLEYQAMVTKENLLELERGALWEQGSDTDPKQPVIKNMMLYMRLQEVLAKRVLDIIRLRQMNSGQSFGGVQKRGRGSGKGNYPFRNYGAEQ